ncbi:carboxymuconolactone decarboxylase family protein [Geodermatophilus sp. YIM 151500]|uniref:carboxymuconolactone decarboxylase family protein n=1 Tax=Geodermatophilus sp. YIM 151500 TaxID=2984531 RepID=UPI0021E45B78|nr:carboxymuconolactone decarboxylase family protein [Geodermatophilus sp. YIM 151500]MCV2488843.1 carboxymuconolactone decarboxylase family protein [Geodermatophilus sp. YIM 151500]
MSELAGARTGTAPPANAAGGPDRLPLPPDDQLTPAQRDAVAEISSGPRGGVIGPFAPLLRSPELMTRVQKVGEHLRFAGGLERRLFEMAILWISRRWDQHFEWSFHHPLALEAGLEPAVADAIAADRRPEGMDPAAAAVWDLLDELHRTRGVSDATFDRAMAELGDAGIVELVVTAGYYTTLAMVMNVARTPVPGGSTLPDLRAAAPGGRA